MQFVADGTYGLVDFTVKMPDGVTITKAAVDVFAVNEALSAVMSKITDDMADSAVNAAFQPVLEKFGIPVPPTHAGCTLIARYLIAARGAVLGKFEGIEKAIIAGRPESPDSIPV